MPAPFPLMFFAAGFGTRMGALTQTCPKPLIKVGSQTLLDHAIAWAKAAGTDLIGPQAINLHYLGQKIADHLAQQNIGKSLEQHAQHNIALSWEMSQLLDTGGGLRAALPFLQAPYAPPSTAVMTLNTDAIWQGENPLSTLAKAWVPDQMDVLFLLLPADQADSADGHSDFTFAADGRVNWAHQQKGALYLGAQIINPDLLSDEKEDVFSLHRPWDKAIQNGRAYGVMYPGQWCDVGHPEGILRAQALLASPHDATLPFSASPPPRK